MVGQSGLIAQVLQDWVVSFSSPYHLIKVEKIDDPSSLNYTGIDRKQ
jgi:hypothetical protein